MSDSGPQSGLRGGADAGSETGFGSETGSGPAGLQSPARGARFGGVPELVAIVATVLWVIFCVVLRLGSDADWSGPGLLIWLMGLVVPVALVWAGVGVLRMIRELRTEAVYLRNTLAGVRPASSGLADPAVFSKLDAMASAQDAMQAQIAALSGRAAATGPAPQPATAAAAAPEPALEDVEPQPSLSLGTPAEALETPVTIPEFIRALNFPETEHDTEGFVMLRKALRDRHTQKLVRASQDALTLMSQDGIYMDDLRPDRARPEMWRAFARGERGRPVAGLGGVHDRSSLALAAGRMKQDPVFRDVVHHFLRAFDQTFMEFERNASDEEIIRLADTRTARAFMLLGRVTGTFD